MDVEIGRVDASYTDRVCTVAARAFWDDPLFNVFQPNLLQQHRALPGYMAWFVKDCLREGEVWAATVDGNVVGAAAWLPPGVPPVSSGLRAVRASRHLIPVMMRARDRRRGLRLLNEVTARHPTGDHWYLGMLATDPLWQGRGVGSKLLQPVLQRADDQGVDVYLETQKESNLAYYGRTGFEVTDTIRLDGCPPIWLMTRRPR